MNVQLYMESVRRRLILEKEYGLLEKVIPQAGWIGESFDACVAALLPDGDVQVMAGVIYRQQSLSDIQQRVNSLLEHLSRVMVSGKSRLHVLLLIAAEEKLPEEWTSWLREFQAGHFLSRQVVHAVWMENGDFGQGKNQTKEPDLEWFARSLDENQVPGHDQVADALYQREEETTQTRALLKGPRPWVTWVLIGLNVFYFLLHMFLAQDIAGQPQFSGREHGVQAAAQAAYEQLGVNRADLTLGQKQYWRLLTSMFIHFGLLHLIINMMALLSLGAFVEKISGHRWMLLIYMVSGLSASALSAVMAGEGISAGASGAILGVVGALLVLKWKRPSNFPRALAMRIYHSLMRSLYLIFGLGVALSLFGGNVKLDNWAHLGGLVTGFFIAWIFPMALVRRINRMV